MPKYINVDEMLEDESAAYKAAIIVNIDLPNDIEQFEEGVQ